VAAPGPETPEGLCRRRHRLSHVLPGCTGPPPSSADSDLPAPSVGRASPGLAVLQPRGGRAPGLLYQAPRLGGPVPAPAATYRAVTTPPRGLRVEALQRLCPSVPNPQHRALLLPTSAAGLWGSAVVPLQLTDLARDRLLLRGEPGQGRQERDPRFATRLLAARSRGSAGPGHCTRRRGSCGSPASPWAQSAAPGTCGPALPSLPPA
jgi:hypothetical protein